MECFDDELSVCRPLRCFGKELHALPVTLWKRPVKMTVDTLPRGVETQLQPSVATIAARQAFGPDRRPIPSARTCHDLLRNPGGGRMFGGALPPNLVIEQHGPFASTGIAHKRAVQPGSLPSVSPPGLRQPTHSCLLKAGIDEQVDRFCGMGCSKKSHVQDEKPVAPMPKHHRQSLQSVLCFSPRSRRSRATAGIALVVRDVPDRELAGGQPSVPEVPSHCRKPVFSCLRGESCFSAFSIPHSGPLRRTAWEDSACPSGHGRCCG